MNQDSGWRKRQIALDKKAENARELGLDYEPRKTIQEMAREAQLPYFYQTGDVANLKQLEAFAALVREDERDRVLKILDDQGTWAHTGDLIELVKEST